MDEVGQVGNEQAAAGTAARRPSPRGVSTQARLIAASLSAIAERGLRDATTTVIATRAGLSQGAVFRHFPRLVDLHAATAEWAGEELIRSFRQRVDLGEKNLLTVLRLVRDLGQSDVNVVWYELMFHSRTDLVLRQRILPCVQHYRDQMAAVAGELAVFAALPLEFRRAGVELVTSTLDGEAIIQHLLPDPTAAAMREQMLLAYARELGLI